ncbi:hypothetical protein Cgig2_008935 [Carnegiea gigantea]|uniref:Endonuclease/exonuclease/phosphatase domain-containing protein n=1 Tax=Carnegiea gigantea TaxID=171969 RepID=A0A9Q1GMH7_9CARY|nr:hypothetical protein Cgig2_008935 [Carnegiea gigantea]
MAWNVQGATKHQIRDEIRVINQANKPDLLFLIETMVFDQTTRKLISTLGYEQFDFVSPQNPSGGLDRAIGRQDWINIYPNAFVTARPFTCSDHSYVYLHTSATSPPNWNHCGDVHSIVKKKWSMQVNGSPMFRLAQRLKAIKKDLKRRSSIKFANYHVQIKKNMTKLHYGETSFWNSRTTIVLIIGMFD